MRRLSLITALFIITASTAYGQTQTLTVEEIKATSKVVVGGSTFGSQPFRITGIASGEGTGMFIDANGDLFKNSAISLSSNVLTLGGSANLVMSPRLWS